MFESLLNFGYEHLAGMLGEHTDGDKDQADNAASNTQNAIVDAIKEEVGNGNEDMTSLLKGESEVTSDNPAVEKIVSMAAPVLVSSLGLSESMARMIIEKALPMLINTFGGEELLNQANSYLGGNKKDKSTEDDSEQDNTNNRDDKNDNDEEDNSTKNSNDDDDNSSNDSGDDEDSSKKDDEDEQ